MKIRYKNFAAFALAMILLPVFWNCTGSQSPSAPSSPITGLEIYQGTENLTGKSVTVDKDEEIILSAVLAPAGVTGIVSWASSDAAVTVSPASGGTVTVKGVTGGGSAVITASAVNDDTAEPFTATVTVTVNEGGSTDPTPITGLTINRNGMEVTAPIAVGKDEEITLSAVLAPAGVTGIVSWTSSDAAVTVSPASGGTVTVKGVTPEGSATITASATNAGTTTPLTATVTVTVNEGGSTDPAPITGLTINRNGVEVTAPIAVGKDEEITLSAVLAPAGVAGLVSWTSSDAAVTVSPASGGTVTVKGVTGGGSAVITASAVNDDTAEPLTATVTVTVNVPPNPNMLFQWNAADDPWESLSTGGNNVRIYAAYPDIHIRAFGAVIPAGSGGGLRLGGEGTAGAGRLAIGLEANTTTNAQDTVTTIAGDFDLSTKVVKLTVNYSDLAGYQSRYVFRVYVNNNGTGETASSLGAASNIITYNGPAASSGTKLTETSGTVEVLIDPSAFQSNANKAALEHAFIGLHCQQAGTANENNSITITGIKIEYLVTGSAGLTVNKPWTEAAFTGFPAEEFTLSKAGSGGYSAAKAITLTGHTQAAWYLDGESVEDTALTYTVDAAGLAKKKHSLTVVVTRDGNLYSRTVDFTVID